MESIFINLKQSVSHHTSLSSVVRTSPSGLRYSIFIKTFMFYYSDFYFYCYIYLLLCNPSTTNPNGLDQHGSRLVFRDGPFNIQGGGGWVCLGKK